MKTGWNGAIEKQVQQVNKQRLHLEKIKKNDLLLEVGTKQIFCILLTPNDGLILHGGKTGYLLEQRHCREMHHAPLRMALDAWTVESSCRFIRVYKTHENTEDQL